MSQDTGVEGVLSALAHFQCDEPVAQIIAACGQATTLAAASIKRAQDSDALCEEVSEPEIISALLTYSGRIGRRRVLSHLRKCRVIQKDVPFHKIMQPGSIPTLKSIVKHAADRNGRKFEEVLSDSKRPENVMARFEAGWVAVRIFGFPVTGISEVMGKNHTTILSGINKVDIMIQRSPVRLDGLIDMADRVDDEAVERFCALFLKEFRGPAGPRSSQ